MVFSKIGYPYYFCKCGFLIGVWFEGVFILHKLLCFFFVVFVVAIFCCNKAGLATDQLRGRSRKLKGGEGGDLQLLNRFGLFKSFYRWYLFIYLFCTHVGKNIPGVTIIFNCTGEGAMDY